ncbi:alkaline phosphatase [Lacihabitans sp. LS3-19]|uniref:phosphatidylinositol-specific phospholipase C/glycerophosphodiester phosphodiesterase family protein n=1 Tax=Lacihabitans sp. LS3-19 TaxID=2487335 RepID=UPI0020CE1BC6|nr:phosphatidylinositol-specific phospholipase C/glycerophosphodiester phosphodiesterase family protein [Lacihabitans sp. LS3-19]MCP9768391.1 alkaline phosphatase [Lacihabitans sp. LS3-19]
MNRISFWFLMLLATNLCIAQKIHSHNDYVRDKPFYEAFEAGASSIEADVYLINNKLFVAHEKTEIDSYRNLENLYLKPLNAVYKKRKNKHIELQILIDCKTSGEATLSAIVGLLNKYPALVNSKNLRFVISGNRPSPEKYADYPAFIFFDHQSLNDLAKADPKKIALVSFSFARFSRWDGKSTFEDAEKLKATIEQVHASGFPIRFWATPDTPLAWETMHRLGVDFINTDSPKACKDSFKVNK